LEDPRLSQAVRTTTVCRSRYRGQAKTGLGRVLSAAAINLHRIDAHLTGRPVGTTCRTHFADLNLSPPPRKKNSAREVNPFERLRIEGRRRPTP
jgi:hypothetical protein